MKKQQGGQSSKAEAETETARALQRRRGVKEGAGSIKRTMTNTVTAIDA